MVIIHAPGYIYTEIELRRWEIGARQNNDRATLRPLDEGR